MRRVTVEKRKTETAQNVRAFKRRSLSSKTSAVASVFDDFSRVGIWGSFGQPFRVLLRKTHLPLHRGGLRGSRLRGSTIPSSAYRLTRSRLSPRSAQNVCHFTQGGLLAPFGLVVNLRVSLPCVKGGGSASA